FFVQGVKDDPQPTLLYDPQLERAARVTATSDDHGEPRQDGGAPALTTTPGTHPKSPLQQLVFQEKQPKEKDKEPPLPPGALTPPRLPVQIEALSELGGIVIRAANKEDLEAALRILDFVQKLAKEAEIQIQLVNLQHADASSVVYHLSQMFSRVNI